MMGKHSRSAILAPIAPLRAAIVTRLIASLGVGLVPGLCAGCEAKSDAQTALTQGSRASASLTLSVEGMTCASCAIAVRTALRRLSDGVQEARVNVKEKRVVVDYLPGRVTQQQMIDAINELGYHATLASNDR